jgi:hypothetical protein
VKPLQYFLFRKTEVFAEFEMGHALDFSAACAFVYPGNGDLEQLRDVGSADQAVIEFAFRRSQRRRIQRFSVLSVIKDRCHCGPQSRFGNPFKSRKQTIDAPLQQLARALLFFVVGKQIENTVQGIELFPKTPDLTQNGLNFVQHKRMIPEWQIFFSERLNQFTEIFNPLRTADEHLNPTRIANKIWLPIFIDSLAESLSAQ